MDCAPDESNAWALRCLGAFVNVSGHNSVPCFYSCTISATSYNQPTFTLFLLRRGNERGYEAFNVKPVNFLKAIRILVACPTLTEVQFSFGDMAYWEAEDSVSRSWSENLLSEVFTLLRSSSSLSSFHFIHYRTDTSLYCKHLQALVSENPRLETLTVSADGPKFVVIAKAIAVCLSRNTVLKSFTLRIPTLFYDQKQQSLEILLRPFTSSSPSEANASIKDLTLYLQYPDGYCVDAISNLLCRNTTLKNLDLRFPTNLSSWTGFRALASALQSNTTLKHVQCIYVLDEYGNYTGRDDAKYITDKDSCQVEFQIQEILRTMIDNELRVNTSLESFVVGHWTLLRVGIEWRTRYRGPCLREQTREYDVNVKMTP